jgi:nitrate reductase gamma subunit
MADVTSSGLTATALASITASVVAGVTALVALIGVLIDRTAARHERKGGQ